LLLRIVTHIACFWYTWLWFLVYDHWKCIRWASV
jgi:hypothetical protein